MSSTEQDREHGEGCRSHRWIIGCSSFLWDCSGVSLRAGFILTMSSPWGPPMIKSIGWVPIGTIACCCLIALPLGGAMLKRELSSIRWVVNWMITGVASSAGGVAIFYPIFFFGDALLRPTPLALSDPIFFVADLLGGTLIIGLAFSLVVGTVIGIESAAVALLLAPLSLLGRRLILRRRSVVESAGDSSQSQP